MSLDHKAREDMDIALAANVAHEQCYKDKNMSAKLKTKNEGSKLQTIVGHA